MNTDSVPATSPWLGFDLAGGRYAVPLADVREVLRPSCPTPVPGAPAEVLGIVSLRGNIVTVLDGRRRLGLPGTAGAQGPQCRLVIFHDDSEHVGMPIDALQDVLDIDSRALMPPPISGRAACANDPLLGILDCGDGFVTLLDARKLCQASEPAMETSA